MDASQLLEAALSAVSFLVLGAAVALQLLPIGSFEVAPQHHCSSAVPLLLFRRDMVQLSLRDLVAGVRSLI